MQHANAALELAARGVGDTLVTRALLGRPRLRRPPRLRAARPAAARDVRVHPAPQRALVARHARADDARRAAPRRARLSARACHDACRCPVFAGVGNDPDERTQHEDRRRRWERADRGKVMTALHDAGHSAVVGVSNAPDWGDEKVMRFFTTVTRNALEAGRRAGARPMWRSRSSGATGCPGVATCARRSRQPGAADRSHRGGRARRRRGDGAARARRRRDRRARGVRVRGRHRSRAGRDQRSPPRRRRPGRAVLRGRRAGERAPAGSRGPARDAAARRLAVKAA